MFQGEGEAGAESRGLTENRQALFRGIASATPCCGMRQRIVERGAIAL